ncbi:hypothetical protein [Gemmatimonas sp.]|jgi:hypothetical protein|uniref:hypothetical protein n=1 Tax=Gemmatimonas sp. TaxID=1962908 RepID=UPI0022BF7299|nr:hypothetical protein [Gemmatimonas sp.]MCZ8203482.1 hypothetical protein [Gemmatimonas sp.]
MIRSIVAVVSGFALIALLSIGTDLALMTAMPSLYEADGSTTSTTVLLLSIGYVGLYATLGCYLCARLAPHRPMQHALVLGALGLLFNVAGTVARWDMAPAWFHLVSLTLVMVWAWLGGRMRTREVALMPSRPITL